MIDGSELGPALGKLRLRKGWSQEHLGKLVGVSATTIKNWENKGKNAYKPSPKNMKKLIEVYIRNGGFTQGKEQEEITQLWEKAQLNAEFDKTWFEELQRDYLSPKIVAHEPGFMQDDQNLTRDIYPQKPSAFLPDKASPDLQRPISSGSKALKDRNLQRMLKVVCDWIEDYQQSLTSIPHISVELQEQPDAVIVPENYVFQELPQSSKLLFPDTDIAQIYDKARGELLILGEPGAGKTILLVELAKMLLERAMNDDTEPIPVIFNLSSWTIQKSMQGLSIEQWLVEELTPYPYIVPRSLAEDWVKNDRLLVLLDGLDEVDPAFREACIQAINSYREKHFVPVVVCARMDNYFALTARLALYKAMTIQPLTRQDIDDYLNRAGKQLEAVRTVLEQDPTLYELVTTPLMLSVLSSAYQDVSPDKFAIPDTLEAKRGWLFDAYIERMLSRHSKATSHTRERTMQNRTKAGEKVAHRKATSYTRERTIHWLSCLASHMLRVPIFYLEYMQADWLPADRLSRAYDLLGIRLPAILIGILVNLVLNNIFGTSDLAYTILYGVIGGVIGYLLSGRQPEQPSRKTWSIRSIWHRLLTRGLLSGLIIAFSVGVSFRLFLGPLPGYTQKDWLHDWLVYGIGFGLCGLLLGVFLVGEQYTSRDAEIEDASSSKGWRRFIRAAYFKNSLFAGGLLGVCSGLGDLLNSPPLRHHLNPLIDGIGDTLCFGLTTLLISILLTQMGRTIQPTEAVSWSWRAFSKPRHLRNGILVGILVGLGLGSVYGANYGINPGLVVGVSYGLGAGLSYWILMGSLNSISSAEMARHHQTKPNEGIRRSARNSLFSGLITGCVSGFTCFAIIMLTFLFIPDQDIPLSPGLHIGPMVALLFGLIVGASVGVVIALLRGGVACLRHGLLRFLLWYSKIIPWNYPQFLDFAAERILLRKVGGGYLCHRLLLEHYAALDTFHSSPAEESGDPT